MAKISEETLTFWTKPPSNTEAAKLENSERMVREAISNDPKLKEKSTETFGQGSYANDTNVRLNSDIDINVRYTGGFFYKIPNDKSKEDFGLNNPSTYSYSEFKDDVETALVNKFGRDQVKRKDKCITILGNSYRVETDVVPTWNHRRYSSNGTYVLGVKFKADSGIEVINYPKQHIKNGKEKNLDTSKRFKRLTRIHRKLRYKMIEDNIQVSDNITSFLLECLVWNVPNKVFNTSTTWTDRLKASIVHLYNKTKEDSTCKDWGEVSELLYLITPNRKWSREDINNYLSQAWSYLEY